MKIYNKDGEIIVDYAEAFSEGVERGINFDGADLSGMKLRNLELLNLRLTHEAIQIDCAKNFSDRLECISLRFIEQT